MSEPRTVDYYRRDVTGEWVVVASLPSAAAWHTAKAMLNRSGITCRMGGPAEGIDSDLLVLSTEAEWARDVLSKGSAQLAGLALTGGFPVVAVKDADGGRYEEEGKAAVAAWPITPGTPSLSRKQPIRYSILSIVLWIVMIALIAAVVVPVLFWLVQ